MPKSILVATSDPAYGELLRSGLEDSGLYGVTLASGGSELLSLASERAYDLAILDAELPGEPFAPLVHGLAAACPRMKVMIVPPENNPRHALLTGLAPHGYIFNPFFLPDLLDGVQAVLAAADAPPPQPLLVHSALRAEGLCWLEDPQRAGQVLARLLLQTDAAAMLVAFEGKLWASAGSLPEPAVAEIAGGLGEWWQDGQKLDLARYLRLRSTGGEHLVYSTALLDQLVLALVYAGGSSLTRARAQSALAAEELSRLAAPQPAAEPDALDEDAPDEEALEINLAALLADMPPPDPQAHPEPHLDSAALEWLREEEINFPWEEGERGGGAEPSAQDWRALLGAADDAPRENCFTCALLPAQPDQHLTGALAEQIGMGIRQICMDFGWRLSGLAVRPGHVQFSVTVGPDGSSSSVASVVRQRTSERIYNRFPHLRAARGGDFWAPGCLDVPGIGSIPVETLRSFITQTRQSQGHQPSNGTVE